HDLPGQRIWGKWFDGNGFSDWRENFIHKCESTYAYWLEKILHWRMPLIALFVAILVFSGWIWNSKLNYVMFPREEGNTFSIRVIGPEGAVRREMAFLIKPIEDIFLNDQRGIVKSVETRIAQS